ncbi:MAG: uroporphyrinogen-III C-methyltransferase [Cytophagales bacterium]|nr:uroporphyrinogen-III C-methyltransferase [Cytophagales bacterium]
MIQPKLTLVGAGPGDPELITVKGIKALASADVVLYDALVHPDLLIYAPARAKKIFVGKRFKVHAASQEEINKLIVSSALKHGHVVRLKGGDPFVFGRGMEEIDYAESFNIPTEVIPGLSSSYAVATSNKIPLTQRGLNESFWVVTGTTLDGSLSSDVSLAAQSSATVVILMGINKLKEIVQLFTSNGKKDTPVVIIQNGTLTNQQMVSGSISTILSIVNETGISSPAVIMIGESVDVQKEHIQLSLAKQEHPF